MLALFEADDPREVFLDLNLDVQVGRHRIAESVSQATGTWRLAHRDEDQAAIVLSQQLKDMPHDGELGWDGDESSQELASGPFGSFRDPPFLVFNQLDESLTNLVERWSSVGHRPSFRIRTLSLMDRFAWGIAIPPEDSPDRRGVGRADDALLGDDAGDELGGGDVEGGVVDVDAVGGRLAAEAVGDLARVALLDGDGRAIGDRQVERARRRRDVEG